MSSNKLDVGTFCPNEYNPLCPPSTPSEPDAQIQIYSSVVQKTSIVCAPGRGLFARLDVHIRPRMASHGVSWVLGADVRFGNLDFIIMMGGELV